MKLQFCERHGYIDYDYCRVCYNNFVFIQKNLKMWSSLNLEKVLSEKVGKDVAGIVKDYLKN